MDQLEYYDPCLICIPDNSNNEYNRLVEFKNQLGLDPDKLINYDNEIFIYKPTKDLYICKKINNNEYIWNHYDNSNNIDWSIVKLN